MMENIANYEKLKQAFQKVKKNRGAGGIDRISIQKFEASLDAHLRELVRTLTEGTYVPLPVKRVLIPKSNGKKRPLGIPTIRDRVAQQAILTEIEPILELLFSQSSYGFRPNRNAHQAIAAIDTLIAHGYEYVVDADIEDFFGTLHHQILMDKVRNVIQDRSVTKLIWDCIHAGVLEYGKIRRTMAGTPQGGVISPMLANLYLNDFDHAIERAGMKLVRYADDFVILAKTANEATHALKLVKDILGKLKLCLSKEKTQIVHISNSFEFLGYCMAKTWRIPRHKALIAFKESVRTLTRRQQPRNVAQVIEKLNPFVRGWGNYFKHGTVKSKFRRLDEWTRARLRSFIEKKKWSQNWKYSNDHFKSLGLVTLTELLTE